MRYTFTEVLLASAIGLASLPAHAGLADGTARHTTEAGMNRQSAPLMVADRDTDTAVTPANPNAATPAHRTDDTVTPAMPGNARARDEVEDHRPVTPEVDDQDATDNDVTRPDVERPTVERPEVERPEMDH